MTDAQKFATVSTIANGLITFSPVAAASTPEEAEPKTEVEEDIPTRTTAAASSEGEPSRTHDVQTAAP